MIANVFKFHMSGSSGAKNGSWSGIWLLVG